MARAPRNPYIITIRTTRRRRKGSVQRTGGISERKKAYLAFINSPQWRTYRAAWWAEYDRRHPIRTCYCCGRPQSQLKRSLELHHRTYERLGHEEYDDLVPVCGPKSVGGNGCHNWITRQWRQRGRTGMTLTLWELTDLRRRQMMTYQWKARRSAGGR